MNALIEEGDIVVTRDDIESVAEELEEVLELDDDSFANLMLQLSNDVKDNLRWILDEYINDFLEKNKLDMQSRTDIKDEEYRLNRKDGWKGAAR